MKKIAIVLAALVFTSCGSGSSESVAVDSTAVNVDSVAVADSSVVATDTTVAQIPAGDVK